MRMTWPYVIAMSIHSAIATEMMRHDHLGATAFVVALAVVSTAAWWKPWNEPAAKLPRARVVRRDATP